EAGPNVEVEVILEAGRAVNQICEVCERIEADLILMGTRGAASPFEQILGSITHQVIQRADVPVLAIPAEATYEPLRVMMYAMGIEQADFKVLARLKEIADLLGAKVICTHVKKDTDTWAKLDLQMLNEIYQMEREGEIEFYVTQFHDVMHGLHKFVTEHQVDWLVMTTHESSQIRHLFDPSLTRQMVLYTDVPLLAFHA
ncbi:MAG: universal stress protein, partial [Bacteroidota bacterium]